MKPTIRANGLAGICLLFAACGVGGHPVHYYTLNYPAAPASTVKADGVVLLVGRIVAPEALEDGRIRFRSGSNEIGAYEYHRWTERPPMMVRELLIQKLRASGKYRQVQESTSSAVGDYLIRGKLFDFSEIDDPGMTTRVSLQLELLDRKTSLVLWDRHYKRDEPVNGHAMKDVVSSLDHNLQQVISDSASDIESFLSNGK
jgi:cholesterol transport system auxiliary component